MFCIHVFYSDSSATLLLNELYVKKETENSLTWTWKMFGE